MKFRKIICLVSYFVFFTIACSTEHDLIESNITEKNIEKNKHLHLINGKDTDGYLWAVKIRNVDTKILCTGSFIQDNLILTSAHCVIEGENEDRIEYEGTRSIQIYSHPLYDRDNPRIEHDLALVVFPNDTSSQIIPISRKHIQDKDILLMIGYGVNDFTEELEGSGKYIPSENSKTNVKRFGYNSYQLDNSSLKMGRIKSKGTSKNMNVEIGDGENVSIGQGDSGGPLLAKNRGLVGVAYGNKMESLNLNFSYHTYLLSDASIKFFAQAKKDNIITTAIVPSYDNIMKNDVNSNDNFEAKKNFNENENKSSSCGVVFFDKTEKTKQNGFCFLLFILPIFSMYLLSYKEIFVQIVSYKNSE